MMRFLVIDANSDDYFVGQIVRAPHEVSADLRALEVGQTFWTNPEKGRGFERAKDVESRP